jgi:zinc protease
MLDRKSAPDFAEINNFTLPTPEVITLTNGVPLVHFDNVSQEVVKVELIFKAGKWFEPKSGAYQFTAQMLEKGTAKRNSFQIAEEFDQLGSSVEISPGFDFTSLSLYTLSKNIKKALPILCEIATSPSFSETEFGLIKDIYKQNLKINNKKISHVASKKIRQSIFGSQHPYGSSLEGSDIDNLTREDLIHFFKERFSLHEIYVTGRIDIETKNMLLDNFSGLHIPIVDEQKIIPYNKLKKSSEYIEIPDSVQSSLRLGKKIINRSDPDYASLVLVNHVLGGYFGSRLMKNIREEKGLTYGIHSSISTLKNDAFFVIGTDVNKENRELAIAEIKMEIIKLQQDLIDPEELKTAKNHLLGSLQLETANPFSVVEKIKVIRLNQLSSDFYRSLFTSIQSSTSESLQRVAEYFNEEYLHEVSVG